MVETFISVEWNVYFEGLLNTCAGLLKFQMHTNISQDRFSLVCNFQYHAQRLKKRLYVLEHSLKTHVKFIYFRVLWYQYHRFIFNHFKSKRSFWMPQTLAIFWRYVKFDWIKNQMFILNSSEQWIFNVYKFNFNSIEKKYM